MSLSMENVGVIAMGSISAGISSFQQLLQPFLAQV
jgi:hypothetical protein